MNAHATIKSLLDKAEQATTEASTAESKAASAQQLSTVPATAEAAQPANPQSVINPLVVTAASVFRARKDSDDINDFVFAEGQVGLKATPLEEPGNYYVGTQPVADDAQSSHSYPSPF